MVPAGRVLAGGVGVGEGAGAGGADAAAEGLVVVAAAAEQAGALFVACFGRLFWRMYGWPRGGRPVAGEGSSRRVGVVVQGAVLGFRGSLSADIKFF